jgi:hypothetical protein
LEAKQKALVALGEAEASLSELLEIHRRLEAATSEVERLFVGSSKLVAEMVKARDSQPQADLLKATQQMQKTQMSFNRLYLQLQNQMQAESRTFTSVSNVLKTRHDTVKNSISNIH